VVSRRTATGSGLGTQTATKSVSKFRTATGSGTGTQTATKLTTFKRVGNASAGTGSSAAIRVISRFRSATGSGVGATSGNATRLITRFRTATGSGVGSETAIKSVTKFRTASGSGAGTQTAVGIRIKTAEGTGSGSGTNGSILWTKSHIFRVPNTTLYAWADLYGDRRADRLFAHMPQGVRAENLFRLSDGSYTINDPGYGNSTRAYLGGHNIFLDDEEVSELTAAGYGAYIS
jgi:hypothetical protein